MDIKSLRENQKVHSWETFSKETQYKQSFSWNLQRAQTNSLCLHSKHITLIGPHNWHSFTSPFAAFGCLYDIHLRYNMTKWKNPSGKALMSFYNQHACLWRKRFSLWNGECVASTGNSAVRLKPTPLSQKTSKPVISLKAFFTLGIRSPVQTRCIVQSWAKDRVH